MGIINRYVVNAAFTTAKRLVEDAVKSEAGQDLIRAGVGAAVDALSRKMGVPSGSPPKQSGVPFSTLSMAGRVPIARFLNKNVGMTGASGGLPVPSSLSAGYSGMSGSDRFDAGHQASARPSYPPTFDSAPFDLLPTPSELASRQSERVPAGGSYATTGGFGKYNPRPERTSSPDGKTTDTAPDGPTAKARRTPPRQPDVSPHASAETSTASTEPSGPTPSTQSSQSAPAEPPSEAEKRLGRSADWRALASVMDKPSAIKKEVQGLKTKVACRALLETLADVKHDVVNKFGGLVRGFEGDDEVVSLVKKARKAALEEINAAIESVEAEMAGKTGEDPYVAPKDTRTTKVTVAVSEEAVLARLGVSFEDDLSPLDRSLRLLGSAKTDKEISDPMGSAETQALIDEVTKSRRIASLKFHPDRCRNDPVAAEAASMINVAFDVFESAMTRHVVNARAREKMGAPDNYGVDGLDLNLDLSLLGLGRVDSIAQVDLGKAKQAHHDKLAALNLDDPVDVQIKRYLDEIFSRLSQAPQA